MNHYVNPDRILVVNGQNDVTEFLKSICRGLGYFVRTAHNFESFNSTVADFGASVVLLDMEIPGKDVNAFLRVLAMQESPAKVILFGGTDSRAAVTTSSIGSVLGLDVVARLPKPLVIHGLRQELRKLKQSSCSFTSARLATAIEAGEIRPCFQPKVERAAGGAWLLSEAEALARWHQPDGNIVTADNFIGLAEDSGLIKALTDSMLSQIARQLRLWAQQGNHLRVALNVSQSLLADIHLADHFEALLQKQNIDNNQIVLEVNEQALFEVAHATVETLNRLHSKQFGLAIDNFGTGYTSLEQLFRMPFDELKIDRSLLQRCETDTDVWTIVETIVLAARKIGKVVCAEGVETQAAFNKLDEIGCDKQQGFLIGKPVPAEELIAMLGGATGHTQSFGAIS